MLAGLLLALRVGPITPPSALGVASPCALGVASAEASASPEAAESDGADESRTLYALVGADSCLNVRERPRLSAAVTLRLSRGDAVCLCALGSDGWAQIDRAGDPGYCRIEYLTDAPPAEPAGASVALPGVRVRSLPRGKVIRRLRKGDTVTVFGYVPDADGDRWANVGDGFVLAACLTLSAP